MNNYETIFLVKNDILEAQRQDILSKVANYIKQNGKIAEIKELGEKNLAYDIQKYKKAYFYVITFEMEEKNINKLEKIYRHTDEILKFITVKSNQ